MNSSNGGFLWLAEGHSLPEHILKTIPSRPAVVLHRLSEGAISCFFCLDTPTEKEIESFKKDVCLTLFSYENVPFLIFIFDGMYFETAVFDADLLCNIRATFIHFIDTKSGKIVAQSTLSIPTELLSAGCEMLSGSPHSIEKMEKLAGRARAAYSLEEMLASGTNVRLGNAKLKSKP